MDVTVIFPDYSAIQTLSASVNGVNSLKYNVYIGMKYFLNNRVSNIDKYVQLGHYCHQGGNVSMRGGGIRKIGENSVTGAKNGGAPVACGQLLSSF